jgi:glycosyltransferase involved in cell wall biosynthesis
MPKPVEAHAMIIVSNGHHKFITGMAASEAEKHGLLAGFITAGYPTPSLRRWIIRLGLDRYAPIKRLLQRKEDLPDEQVYSLWLSEILYTAARVVATRFPRFEDIADYALRCYSWQAERIVNELSGRIYHYRSGYGHNSVRRAKNKGMVVLCDHSIAHPSALAYLVNHGGRLPPRGETPVIGKLWGNILKDVAQADFVLVNSDFVKDTFIHFGYDPARIFVLYTGIDDQFLSSIPARSHPPRVGQLPKLMFAGDLGARKGGHILLRALSRMCDLPWECEVIGTIDERLRNDFRDFFSDERVSVSGFLPRAELAARMSTADIFVFPSLAEGSARVVFMAMACGCYVITTPNSGSIVRDGVHGKIVEPGNADALEAALRESLRNFAEVPEIGRKNAELVKTRYTQRQYGESLMAIYGALATDMLPHRESGREF